MKLHYLFIKEDAEIKTKTPEQQKLKCYPPRFDLLGLVEGASKATLIQLQE